MLADMNRRLNSLEGQYGVFGQGMTVTGATVETAEPGTARVYLSDSPAEGLYVEDSGGHVVIEVVGGTTPGLTAYDDNGNTVFTLQGGPAPEFIMYASGSPTLWLLPSSGLGLIAGQGVGNTVYWGNGASRIAFIQGYTSGSNAIHMHAGPGGSGYYGTDLTLFSASSGEIMSLWTGSSTNTKLWSLDTNNFFSMGGYNAYGNSGVVGTLNVTGACTAGSFATNSGLEEKDSIVDLDAEPSLIHQLRIVRYHHRQTDREHYGVIAEEIRDVLPEVVLEVDTPQDERVIVEDEDGEQRLSLPEEIKGTTRRQLAVDLQSVFALAVAEIQRLEQRVHQLELREQSHG